MTPDRNSTTPIRRTMKAIADVLSSRNLSMVLLIVVLSLCVTGTLAPQEGVEPSRTIRAWNEEHAVLGPLGLTNIFAAWYFFACLALTFIHISVSTTRLIRRTRRSRDSENVALTVEQVLLAGNRARCPFIVRPEAVKKMFPFSRFRSSPDGGLFRAERFSFARWSMAAFHLSLLIIISGALLNRAQFYRGVYSLVEKDHFVAGLERPTNHEQGFFSTGKIGPTKVVLDIVHDHYEQEGYQPSLASRLIVEGSGERKEVLITRAEPVRFNGLTIYQSPTYGYAPIFTRIQGDRKTSGSIQMAAGKTPGDKPGVYFSGVGGASNTGVSIECSFRAMEGFVGIPEKVLVRFMDNRVPVYEAEMAAGDEALINSEVYRLEEIRYWTDVIVSKQPWTLLLYAGFFGAFFSLLSFSLVNPYIVFGYVDREQGTTVLSVRCLRFRSSEALVLKKLASRMQRDPCTPCELSEISTV